MRKATRSDKQCAHDSANDEDETACNTEFARITLRSGGAACTRTCTTGTRRFGGGEADAQVGNGEGLGRVRERNLTTVDTNARCSWSAFNEFDPGALRLDEKDDGST